MNPAVRDLLDRSNRLGADRRNTNYAGGNTSAKGTEVDPATGHDVELLWVKGSGGDLGTLTESGLAVLRLDRLRRLVDVYPGEEREDEMVAAFDYCLHGRGGAAPSIDTAMHGLVTGRPRRPPPPRCRHRHRHRRRRRAAHQGHLRRQGRVGAVAAARLPARPRHRRRARDEPAGGRGDPRRPRHHRVGRHQRRGRGQQPLDHRDGPGPHRRPRPGRAVRSRGRRPPASTRGRTPGRRRRAGAAACAPSLPSDHRMVGHFIDSDDVLDFLSGQKLEALAELGTSCPDHFLRTKIKPLVVAGRRHRRRARRRSTSRYRADYAAYYEPPCHARRRRPMRGADPTIILVPGVGMFSYGRDKQTARSPASSTSTPSTSCAAPSRCRPTPPSRSPRSSASSTGPSRRPSCSASRSRVATPGASRWSPGRPAASARPSPANWPPTGRAS